MIGEPLARESITGNALVVPVVRGVLGDHGDAMFAPQPASGPLVLQPYLRVCGADDEQRGCEDRREAIARQLQSAVPRYHRTDLGVLGSGPERRDARGTGTEKADRQAGTRREPADPTGHGEEPDREELDVASW